MTPMRPLLVMACAALSVVAPLASAAPPANVAPEADRVLRAMTTYVAGLKEFTARTENSLEAVTPEGQKIQYTAPATLAVSRPNKLFAERRGDIVDQAFYYDGKSLTLYNPGTKHFATVPAPASIDEALDFARLRLDIIAPGADLIDTRAYQRLMEDVTSGLYLGSSVVGGHRCHHLAYRAGEVDWQLWVREGDKPLPCKYVITSRDLAGSPQFTVQIVDWDTAPKLASGMFDFAPPTGAKRIEFMPIGGGSP